MPNPNRSIGAKLADSSMLRLALDVADRVRRHDLAFLAAGLAFYAFLAFVPLILVIVLLYGMLADPATAVEHVRLVAGMVSPELARRIGDTVIKLVLDTQEQKGIGVAVSTIVALYAGIRGARGFTKAIDKVHEKERPRSFLKASLLSVGVVLSVVLVATAALVGIVVLGYLEDAVANISGLLALAIKIGTWMGVAALAGAAISALYRYVPSGPAPERRRWISYGAMAATFAWCAATVMLGIYVTNFSRYDAIYGSAATIVVTLIWFYISSFIVLAGAELDVVLVAREGEGEA